MSVDSNVNVPVILVINTNLYTGNFERELCAYVTGCVGECDVGAGEARIFVDEEGEELQEEIGDIISFEADDHGCRRPTSIWQDTDFGHYESMAIFFQEAPDPAVIQKIVDRAQAYATYRNNKPGYDGKRTTTTPLAIKGAKIIHREVKITDEVKVLL